MAPILLPRDPQDIPSRETWKILAIVFISLFGASVLDRCLNGFLWECVTFPLRTWVWWPIKLRIRLRRSYKRRMANSDREREVANTQWRREAEAVEWARYHPERARELEERRQRSRAYQLRAWQSQEQALQNVGAAKSAFCERCFKDTQRYRVSDFVDVAVTGGLWTDPDLEAARAVEVTDRRRAGEPSRGLWNVHNMVEANGEQIDLSDLIESPTEARGRSRRPRAPEQGNVRDYSSHGRSLTHSSYLSDVPDSSNNRPRKLTKARPRSVSARPAPSTGAEPLAQNNIKTEPGSQ